MSWTDADFTAAFAEVDNAGRWGEDDELGTLNHITPETVVRAARLVETGLVLSLAHPLTSEPTEQNIELRAFYAAAAGPSGAPPFAGDRLTIEVHQQSVTHLDCISHIGSHLGLAYNKRPMADVASANGVRHGSINAQRGGIVTRGVFLDVAAALGVRWLEPTHEITPEDLEAAETYSQVRVQKGDALVLRSGSEARGQSEGWSPLMAGPSVAAARWMQAREIAVYTGDAPDHISDLGARILGRQTNGPSQGREAPSSERFPLPFHQIAIPAMGLVLLDHAAVEELASVCCNLGRYEFLFVASPLPIQNGSGSPVNPLAIF